MRTSSRRPTPGLLEGVAEPTWIGMFDETQTRTFVWITVRARAADALRATGAVRPESTAVGIKNRPRTLRARANIVWATGSCMSQLRLRLRRGAARHLGRESPRVSPAVREAYVRRGRGVVPAVARASGHDKRPVRTALYAERGSRRILDRRDRTRMAQNAHGPRHSGNSPFYRAPRGQGRGTDPTI